MPEHIDSPQHRLSTIRREWGKEDFSYCPKYAQHDLSRDQMKDLIEEVVEAVLYKIDTEERREAQMKWIYKNLMADGFKEGKSIAYSFIVFLGFIAMVAYGWLSNHPFK